MRPTPCDPKCLTIYRCSGLEICNITSPVLRFQASSVSKHSKVMLFRKRLHRSASFTDEKANLAPSALWQVRQQKSLHQMVQKQHRQDAGSMLVSCGGCNESPFQVTGRFHGIPPRPGSGETPVSKNCPCPRPATFEKDQSRSTDSSSCRLWTMHSLRRSSLTDGRR